MKMPDHLNKFININKTDADFLMCIANTASIEIDDLYKILMFSSSDYVEFPLDDTEYPDINDGYEDKYEWVDDGPVRTSRYGKTVDYELQEYIFDNHVENNRLTGITIDFSESHIKNPEALFSAVVFALQKFRDVLVLEVLSFCALQSDIDIKFPAFEIRLPFLRVLRLNRINICSINFASAPRLQFISIIDLGINKYDFSRLPALEELCIGDCSVDSIKLSISNNLNKIIIGKGYLPSVRDKNNGLGINLEDLISNIGFSVQHLTLAGCGISKIDLSICSNLKYLDLSNNPINNLNLAWVPRLEYLNLDGTGVQNMDTGDLTKPK